MIFEVFGHYQPPALHRVAIHDASNQQVSWVREFPATVFRGRDRNFNLRVPLINTGSTVEWLPTNRSQNFAGSAEPVEPVLTRPLLSK